MNGFRTLQKRLREEGWYVGWNHYCCQSCAWDDVPFEHEEGPFTGEDVDLNKVLFNHSQDCEYDWQGDAMAALPDDKIEEFFDAVDVARDIEEDDGVEGLVRKIYEDFGIVELYDDTPEGLLREGSFVCYPPEQQGSSLFCFAGDKEGVKNLKEILPVIEECGCKWHWDQTGNSRIEISWSM